MGRKYEQQLALPIAAEQLGQLAYQVLGGLPRVRSSWGEPGAVHARTGTGMASWGENVSVHIRPVSGGSQLLITSQCMLRTQFIDYGRNRRNVELIVNELLARCS